MARSVEHGVREQLTPDFTDLPEMLTKAEVASITRQSLSSVNREIARGDLVAIRFGKRSVRVSKKSLVALCSRPYNQ